MIRDQLNLFALGVTVTGAAGTRNAGDVIDQRGLGGLAGALGQNRDLGVTARPVYWVITINVAPTGADTVEFKLVSDSENPPRTNGNEVVHLTTGAIAVASLPVGTIIAVPLPREGVDVYQQYVGTQVTNVGIGSLANLNFDAFLTLDPPAFRAYDQGAVAG